MALAVNTGIPHTVWLDDPAAMMTAYRVLSQQADHIKRQQR